MKQVFAIVLAGLGALGVVMMWPKLMTPPAPDSGPTLSTASLVSVDPPAKYEWVDRTQGVARIPIDRAMELVVAEARAKQPASAEAAAAAPAPGVSAPAKPTAPHAKSR